MCSPYLCSTVGTHVVHEPENGNVLLVASIGSHLCSSPHAPDRQHERWCRLTSSPVPSLPWIMGEPRKRGRWMGIGLQIETTHLKELQLLYKVSSLFFFEWWSVCVFHRGDWQARFTDEEEGARTYAAWITEGLLIQMKHWLQSLGLEHNVLRGMYALRLAVVNQWQMKWYYQS